jgi:hypothetical protein
MEKKRVSPIVILLCLMTIRAFSQGIVSITPSSAPLYETGVDVIIVLDSASSPPGPILPTSVNIGPSAGTNVTRSSQYVYATFDFTHMLSGIFNVTVVFEGPPPAYPSIFFTQSAAFSVTDTSPASWTIPGTAVSVCYDTIASITCPTNTSEPFYGQNNGIHPKYIDNGDGTVTDSVTGLMWQQDPGAKKTFMDAITGAKTQALGGYNDWRLPTIKELYSLIEFTGTDPNVRNGTPLSILTPFIDTGYFVFQYGDTTNNERIIDSQYWSCNEYVSTTMGGNHSVFGVNFADGRIKSYPRVAMNGDNKMFTQYVRGGSNYGINRFYDNGDNTVSDSASRLMWMKDDSQAAMNWEEALAFAQQKNSENYCGYNDWRLPHTKELESIIDYSRSPYTTHSAAINPLFNATQIMDEAGFPDWPWYWATTTHISFDGIHTSGSSGVYVCFGSAFGWQQAPGQTYMYLSDVHGAGAQRSSPKSGNYLGDSLGVDSLGHSVYGRGPQGDVLRVNNFVRLVRDLPTSTGIGRTINNEKKSTVFPNPFSERTTLLFPVSGNTRNALLLIYDILGNKVRIMNVINSGEAIIERGNLQPGVYFYQLSCDGKMITSGKLIIE